MFEIFKWNKLLLPNTIQVQISESGNQISSLDAHKRYIEALKRTFEYRYLEALRRNAESEQR